jgi:hypothetical protein
MSCGRSGCQLLVATVWSSVLTQVWETVEEWHEHFLEMALVGTCCCRQTGESPQ